MILGAYCRTQQRFRRIILCNSGSCFNRSPPRFFYSSSLHLPSSSYHHFSMNPCTKRPPPPSPSSFRHVIEFNAFGAPGWLRWSAGCVWNFSWRCMSGVGVSVLSGVGFTEGSTCALEGHVSEGKSPTPVLLGLLMLLLPVASLLLSLEWGRSAN